MYNNYNSYNNNISQTLAALNSLIINAERGLISSHDIVVKVKELENAGFIKVVGQGMNRIAVEINGDVSQFINFAGPAIFKIPFSTVKGIDDNIRELMFIEILKHLTQNTTGAISTTYSRLIGILPAVSEVAGYPALIAQEKVIPIDKSQEVVNRTQYSTDKAIISQISTDLILSKYKHEFEQLMVDLKEAAVFADLNPLATPDQYGLINRNGVFKLTILDTGYIIPLLPELKAAISSNNMNARYIIPGRDFTISDIPNTSDKKLTPTASDINHTLLSKMNVLLPYHGVYLNTSSSSKHDIGRQIIKDMDYFISCYGLLRDIARTNPNSISGRFFLNINQKKNFS